MYSILTPYVSRRIQLFYKHNYKFSQDKQTACILTFSDISMICIRIVVVRCVIASAFASLEKIKTYKINIHKYQKSRYAGAIHMILLIVHV